jgi:AbrB family looped-hinge helix DNA binding protein
MVSSLNISDEGRKMPLRKVRKFYQVSLPAHLSRKLGIAEGDYVEMVETPEGILVKPVVVTERVAAARLSPKEQQLLARARTKIDRINKDIIAAKGLTKEEAKVAAKAGLIDPDQVWWWLEPWQKKEREAEADIKAGRVVGPFDTAEELIKELRRESSALTTSNGISKTFPRRLSGVLRKPSA